MGGGLDLALSCDIRCASSGAVFAHPGARLGIITGGAHTAPVASDRYGACSGISRPPRVRALKLRDGLISRIVRSRLTAREVARAPKSRFVGESIKAKACSDYFLWEPSDSVLAIFLIRAMHSFNAGFERAVEGHSSM